MLPEQRKVFFNKLRLTLFKNGFNATQVKGIDAILDYWYDNHNEKPIAFLAYIFATAYWETARAMFPVIEHGGKNPKAYYTKMYDITGSRPLVAKRLGNTQKGDGAKYPGMGMVQCTGRANYAKVDKMFGFQTILNPTQMLDLHVSVKVLIEGMLTGLFTNVELADVIDGNTETEIEFLNNRRIINGNDKAREIAQIAVHFQNAIIEAMKVQVALSQKEKHAKLPEIEFVLPKEPEVIMQNDINNDADFIAWKEERLAKKAQAEYEAANVKPLIASTVTKYIVGGVASLIAVKYGIHLPPEMQSVAENVIVGIMSAGALWGRAKAKTFIKGAI